MKKSPEVMAEEFRKDILRRTEPMEKEFEQLARLLPPHCCRRTNDDGLTVDYRKR